MKSLLDKLTFRLLIGQLLPGATLTLTGWVSLDLVASKGMNAISQIGVIEMLSAYVTVLTSFSGVRVFVLLTILATVLGLVLQTTTNLSTANRESFRKNRLDTSNRWVEKDPADVRRRSAIRKWVAIFWYQKGLWSLLPLAPLILLFDFFTVLAARPRDLYKEIYLVRTAADKMEGLEAVISDYEYSADYFGNMALALTGHLLLSVVFLDFPGPNASGLLYLSVAYGLVSLHYVSFRSVRGSVDQALYLTFATPDVEEGRE